MKNREIKFRIWNGREMEYNITVGKFGTFYVNPEKGDGLNPNDTASLTPNTTKYSEGTPLMQFTGLLDKNGKEIYEYDILMTETDKPMVITWSKKFASFCISREGWAFQHWFGEACDPSRCEVIGNIYENPELLKP